VNRSDFLLRVLIFLALSLGGGCGTSQSVNAAERVTLQVYPQIQWAKVETPLYSITKIYARKDVKEIVKPIPVDLTGLIGNGESDVQVPLTLLKELLVLSMETTGYDLRVVGPSRVTFKKKVEKTDKARLIEFAKIELQNILQGSFDKVTLTPATKSISGVALHFDDRLRIDKTDYLSQLSHSMTVGVEVLRRGVVVSRVPVGFSVSVHRDVLVLLDDMSEMERVTPDLIQRKLMDITAIHRDVLNDEGVVGSMAKHRLRKGMVLKEGDLLPVPDVIKGDAVNVISRVGVVTIRAGAIALSHGYVGESIRAKNAKSGEIFEANVIAKNQLSVDDKG